MTEINQDHMEWAVVARLSQMLERPPTADFDVTLTYAIFTSVLCWVMQRIRIRIADIKTEEDNIAKCVRSRLSQIGITDEPWNIQLAERNVGAWGVVEAPRGIEGHKVERLLINLRDAIAHGDARTVKAFNIRQRLVGFRFSCAEYEGYGKNRRRSWDGEITLLKEDMRRIAIHLAKTYCSAMESSAAASGDFRFAEHATRSVREIAA